jgi:hypothetical protein
MATLRSVIESCAATFATAFAADLISKLGDLPLSELTNLSGAQVATSVTAKTPRAAKTGKGGRMARRDPEALKGVIDQIVHALISAPDGLSSEQLQKATGLGKKEITRPIVLALEGGLIRKEGQKRATKYMHGGGAQAGAKRAAKAAKKAAKPAKKAVAKKPAKPVKKVSAKPAASKKPAAKKPAAKKPADVAPESKTEAKADAAAE